MNTHSECLCLCTNYAVVPYQNYAKKAKVHVNELFVTHIHVVDTQYFLLHLSPTFLCRINATDTQMDKLKSNCSG